MASTRGGEDGEEEGEEEKKSGNLASANHRGLLFQEYTQGRYTAGFAAFRGIVRFVINFHARHSLVKYS